MWIACTRTIFSLVLCLIRTKTNRIMKNKKVSMKDVGFTCSAGCTSDDNIEFREDGKLLDITIYDGDSCAEVELSLEDVITLQASLTAFVTNHPDNVAPVAEAITLPAPPEALTKREIFAGQALQGLLSSGENEGLYSHSRVAVGRADQLIKELESKNKQWEL